MPTDYKRTLSWPEPGDQLPAPLPDPKPIHPWVAAAPPLPRPGCWAALDKMFVCMGVLAGTRLLLGHGMVILVLPLAGALWVFSDTRALGVRKGLVGGWANNSRATWVIGSLLLWSIVFPCYLAARPLFIRARAPRRQAGKEPMAGAITASGRTCADRDPAF